MVDRMKISVTQKNIDEGGFASTNCPVALAIRDVMPDKEGRISVWPHIIMVAGTTVRPSPELAEWITAYDNERLDQLLPFEFELDLE
jgi:hypothetical protein